MLIHPETEVRAGGQTGTADVADDLPLGNFLALFHAAGKPAHVQVEGLVGAVVSKLDMAAVVAVLGYPDNGAVADGLDRCAGRGGIIDGRMRLPGLGDRMVATHGKAG